jgi:hypothetical protein
VEGAVFVGADDLSLVVNAKGLRKARAGYVDGGEGAAAFARELAASRLPAATVTARIVVRRMYQSSPSFLGRRMLRCGR